MFKAWIGSAMVLAMAAVSAAVPASSLAWSPDPGTPTLRVEGENTLLAGPQGMALGSDGLLYVANESSSEIVAFPISTGFDNIGPSWRLSGTQTGIRAPRDVAFDDDGSLYVLTASSVLIFPPGREGPSATPANVLSGPDSELVDARSLVLDSVGRLYVVNSYELRGGDGSITIYEPGWGSSNARPSAVLRGPRTGLRYPSGIAFDQTGLLYVSTRDSVLVFDPSSADGDVPPLAVLRGANTSLVSPMGLDFDDLGFMYVTTWGGANSASLLAFEPDWRLRALPGIDAFLAPVNIAPIAVVRGVKTGLDGPRDVVLAGDGTALVSNNTANRVVGHSLRLQVIEAEVPSAIELGADHLDIWARASSGLPPVIESVSPSVCKVSDATAHRVSLLDVGQCRLRLLQSGDVSWAPAPSREVLIQVEPSTQQIAPRAVDAQVLGSQPLQLRATTTSGLPVTWRSQTPSVCRTTGPFGKRLRLSASGTCQVEVRQSGNRKWRAATALLTIEVREPEGPRPQVDLQCSLGGPMTPRTVACQGGTRGISPGTEGAVALRVSRRGTWRAAKPATVLVNSDGTFLWSGRVPNSAWSQVRVSFPGVSASSPRLS